MTDLHTDVDEREVDVVVVGAGAAGCVAALRAAEGGAKVVVLEADSSAGGTTIVWLTTVADGVVYFPDWNGYLYAVNAQTGGLIWQQQISNRTPLSISRARTIAVIGIEKRASDNPPDVPVRPGDRMAWNKS